MPEPPARNLGWNGGWPAMRRDWDHFCRVAGVSGLWGRLTLLLTSTSLWGLWSYRYGRWAYSVRVPRLVRLPLVAFYHWLYLATQLYGKIAIDIFAEVEMDVWFGPSGIILVGPYTRVGEGSRLDGHNTLGVGGRPGARGLPVLGKNVHVGHGTVLVGPVTVPDNTILGPNSVVTRSLPEGGAYTGVPAKPYEGDPDRLAAAYSICREREPGKL